MKPKVALTMGETEDRRQLYRNALISVDIEPIENPASLDGLDGLMLSGGADIEPTLYGATREPQTQPPNHELDQLESTLLREALKSDLPVLGLCRGSQMLNVVLGGTLKQHIDGHRSTTSQEVHPIDIEPGSRLANILQTNQLVINSRHHQCIDKVADGLVVTARAPDGIIEAVEMPGKHFVLAVQWHPEMRIDKIDARLFSAFHDAVQSTRIQ